MVQAAETIFRDFTTDGIPASGAHEPRKVEIREWGTALEAFRDAGLASGSSAIYDTRANLEANIVWVANTLAWVIADPVAANNGIYRKIGSSGTGSWSRVGDLPYSFIRATDAGAGTPDAIQATSSIPVSSSALVALNIFEANTGSPVTVSFNGGTALAIKTNSGNDIAPGGLAAGMIVAGYVSGSTFRLISDQASAAIVAAAEAAQAAAEEARDQAIAAAAGVNLPVITSGDAGKVLVANGDEDGYELVDLVTVDKTTIAAAIADSPNTDPDFYRVAFFATGMSRASGGLYKKIASEPAHLGKFRNRAGAGSWYELDEDEITPQMLGWESGDLTPAFAACVDMGRPIKLPKRAGGYVVNTDLSKVLTTELIVDFQGQKIAFDHNCTWEFKGAEVATGRLPSSSRVRYQTDVALNSVAGIQPGDIFYINNPNQSPLAFWGDTKKECILITSVDSGAGSLVLAAGLNFNWTLSAADNFVDIYRPQKVTFIRPWFHLASPVSGQPHYAVHLVGLRDIELVSPKLTAPLTLNRESDIYRMGIQIWKCWGWTATDMYTEGMAYPIGVYGGTRNGFEYRTKAHYCHHGHADLGDFASDYILDGFHATDCYMALSTHPVFRAFAKNIDVQNDFDVSNWRCIGGGISNGVIRTSANDTNAGPQFNSEAPASGFDYLYDDADFYCVDFKFSTNGTRTTKDLFWVTLGRKVYYANITVPRLSDPTTAIGIDFLTFGPGIVSLSGTTFRAQGNYINGVLQ